MKKSLNKDIVRTIWKEKKRFFAIMMITMLGVTVMTCLGASCRDLRLTADEFYRNQNLFDVQLVSTLGLTEEDITVLEKLEEVKSAEGTYTEVVRTKLEEQNKTAEMKMYRSNGINVPFLVEGNLPQQAEEIAVTQNYITETGKKIGDTLEIFEFKEESDEEEIEEDENQENENTFLYSTYTISGVVIDVADINNPGGSVAFRATPNADYTFFVIPETIDSEVYTGIYLTLEGVSEYMTYSQEYEEKVASVISMIETEIMEVREQARYDEITGEILHKIAEKEAEMNEEFAKAEKELEDAKAEISDGKQKLADGKQQLLDGKQKLSDGKEELEQQQANAKEEIANARKEIKDGYAKIEEQRAFLMASNMLTPEAEMELEGAKAQLDAGATQINAQETEANKQFANAWAEIRKSEEEIKKSEAELLESEAELLEGEAELSENLQKFEEEKADAKQKIQDAREEVNDIEMPQWYVQDRTTLSGYSNVSNDADTIESLATVFMVVFFIVAILISLTTITRMVEEERGLIGTYKALGFFDKEIRKKYIIYAFAASLAGGILGDFAGFVILPEIIFIFFDVMYLLPEYHLYFDAMSGILSVILFMAGITGAALFACKAALKHSPASLMRPKAPALGSRVLLERIKPVWKRLTFLNKVTVRNLFRYKKRLLMTVFGIMGCTALVVFGFAIKDSVEELMPLQYDNVNQYDLLAATSADDNEKLIQYMEEKEEVSDYLSMHVTTVKLENADRDSEKVQLMVFANEEAIKDYLHLTNAEKMPITLQDKGVYLTENAARILGLKKGDTLSIQTPELLQEEAVITDLVKNYLGNNLYMTKAMYEEMFGTFEENGVLVNLSEDCKDHIAFSKTLSEQEWILTSLCTQDMKENFSLAFTLINIVVYVVLVMAAGLAFVVLFTLASINISERNRELATIKVLGFFDREVHSYVNKETLILTAIGIMLGLPVGRIVSGSLTYVLSVPSVFFEVTIYPRSYVFAVGISLLFALMVQFLTNHSLDVIDPVEALKSVE